MPTRFSYPNPYAEVETYTLYKRRGGFSDTEFILEKRNGDLRQRWGCAVSDEILFNGTLDVVAHHVARELASISGISDEIMYEMLSRLQHNGMVSWNTVDRTPVLTGIDYATAERYGIFSATNFGFSLYSSPPEQEGDSRAQELFLSHLTPDQKNEFGVSKTVTCVGVNSGLSYKIHYGRVINVERSGEDGRKERYCLVQESNVPLYDQLLTQKLLIENDEQTFLQKANHIK